MNVDVTNFQSAIQSVESLASSGNGAYVCAANVHTCMEAFDSSEFRTVVNEADLVLPDGRPIFWAQRHLGAESPQQVRGPDVMNAVCKMSVSSNLKIGLYGGSSNKSIEKVRLKLQSKYPGIQVVYTYSPPFRPLTESEDTEVIQGINHAQVNVLFVGIGCPKQERWMAAHKNQLNCVMLGVGAAFAYIAGNKKNAPRWMQIMGLEWFFRLLSEPTRLWKRYLIQNPRFIFHYCKRSLFGEK